MQAQRTVIGAEQLHTHDGCHLEDRAHGATHVPSFHPLDEAAGHTCACGQLVQGDPTFDAALTDGETQEFYRLAGIAGMGSTRWLGHGLLINRPRRYYVGRL